MEDLQQQKSQSTVVPDDEIVQTGSAFVKGEPSHSQDDDQKENEKGPPEIDSKSEFLHEKVTKKIIKEGRGEKPSKYSTCFWEPSQDDENGKDKGPPKIDSKSELLHDKVTTKIINEGRGEKPSKYSTCFLHYRGWTESTQHKFEDTWQEQRPIEMILGKEKKEMAGLAIGVSSMKAGECALINVGWELGYGKEGNFSFPNVPPQADIVYEVELIGFDETKEGKARGDMTVEERIGAADRRKMEGNVLFKDDKLEEAMQQYEMAIAYMGDDFMFQLMGKYRDMALAVKNPCHLNIAACMIKLERYNEAIGQCTIVLGEDENNVKALFRRGKAKSILGQTDAAREDFLKARKYAPGDKAIAKELRLLDEHDKAVYRKQKEMYKGILGKAPEPKPQKTNWLIFIWQWLVALFSRLFKSQRKKTD